MKAHSFLSWVSLLGGLCGYPRGGRALPVLLCLEIEQAMWAG